MIDFYRFMKSKTILIGMSPLVFLLYVACIHEYGFIEGGLLATGCIIACIAVVAWIAFVVDKFD